MQSIPSALFSIYATIQDTIYTPEEQPHTDLLDIPSILESDQDDSESNEYNNPKQVHNASINTSGTDTAQLQESLTQIPTDDEYEPQSQSSDNDEPSLDSSDWDSMDSDDMEFSNIHPYIATEYSSIQHKGHINEEECEIINDVSMNWNDKQSVNKIKDLMCKLLQIASTNVGIREDELYLMFATPSPQSIIQHLRFGLLSDLCAVRIDRFGRRSYFYERGNRIVNHNSHHVFSGVNLPTKFNLLVQDGIGDLFGFMADTPSIATKKSGGYSRVARYSRIVKEQMNGIHEDFVFVD